MFNARTFKLPRFSLYLAALVLFLAALSPAAELEPIRVSPDKKSFVLEKSGRKFTPWGFNYDHDEDGRLIEDYWEKEWPKVAEDFREMKELGANVVRIHLQFGKFMEAADKPKAAALAQFDKLLTLSEEVGLYLDVTGLGCYHRKDVPAWYDELDEAGRWNAQARFWEAVAERGAKSNAVFFYDLMNEPVVPGGKRKEKDWLGPAFGDKHFVQVITLDQAERPRAEIAKAWVEKLTAAVRKKDPKHLVTVGLVDWSLDRPGLTSGFVPDKIHGPLDFLCVHMYPEKGKLDKAKETLAGFAAISKPVIIEETFPLKCSMEEFRAFLDDSRDHASGWIGFYWGKTPDELRKGKTFSDAITLAWLEEFQKRAKEK
jgi:hypothetical protein